MKHSEMRLKDIAEITTGYPFRGKISEMSRATSTAVQMKDIINGQKIDWRSTTQTALTGKRSPDWLKPSDILFAARGNNNYAVMVEHDIADRQAVAAPHFYVIQSKHRSVLPEYLAWLLNQAPSQRYFRGEAEGTLTKSIRRRVLENTPVAIPTQERQHTIVNMAKTLKQEQQLIQQLIHNGETIMNAIANDLLKG